jgi:uncharacterized protein with HEPN domain
MSDKNTSPLLEFVLQMIAEIEYVTEKHKGTSSALNDIEGRNAILMNLLQIGEKLNKITDETIRSLLPVKEAYSVRNRITHDYGGIAPEILEYIINNELPELKKKINGILK